MRKSNLSPGELGHEFEEKVKRILESNGYVILKKNQWKTNYAFEKDKARKREYDLVAFYPRDRQVYIIECKSHFKDDKNVGLELVVEFNRKLENNNGLSAVRVMVSDNGFTHDAIVYAHKNNIRLINGYELGSMERRGRFGSVITSKIISSGLEGLVRGVMKNYSK